MLKPAILALLVLGLPALAEDARLKVGTVDMLRLFKGYHRTEAAQRESNVDLARLQKQDGDRQVRIREIEGTVEKLRKEIGDPAIAASKKTKLLQRAEDQRQEGIALEQERREFVERHRRTVQERMVQEMKGLVAEIRKQLEEIARAENYDYVFDSSGLSASQVPFVLVNRQADDLTEVVLTKLNAGVAEKEAKPVPK